MHVEDYLIVCQNITGIFQRNYSTTYMTTAVQSIVGELDLIEQHCLRHPVRSQRRAVRMQVYAIATLWLGSASGHPLRAGVLESAIANRHHFDHYTVVGVLLQAGDGSTQ